MRRLLGLAAAAILLMALFALPGSAQSTAPKVSFLVNPISPTEGEAATFQDMSTGVPRGTPRVWDFGDGTPRLEGTIVNHTFAKSGSYTVRLNVSGTIATKVVRVTQLPLVAAFDVSPAQPVARTRAVFIDRSVSRTGNLTGWSWDFGDGTRATDELRPSHTYAEPGTYTVRLQVVDDDGHKASIQKLVNVLSTGGSPVTSTKDPAVPGLPLAALAAAALVAAWAWRRRGDSPGP